MELLMGSGDSSSKESSPLSKGPKFGQKIYFEDGSGSSRNRVVKSSTSRCQVEGCRVDLSNGKAYYSRHKVCCFHSKSTRVIVSGFPQRFCQQCSRFHQLSEFDLEKRSCRRRLACHNERRRKPPPTRTLLSTSHYSRIAPSLYGNTKSVLGDSTTAMRLSGPWQSDSERKPYQLMNVFSNGSSSLMMNNNGTDSDCALSLLSNSNQQHQKLWTSTDIWRQSSVDKVTVALSPLIPIHNQYMNLTWESKEVEKSNSSRHMSQISELSLHQEVMRQQYMEPDNTSSYPQIFNWSL